MNTRSVRGLAATLVLPSMALAQGAAFQTPGMPSLGVRADSGSDSGQASRFSNEFNPALSFIVDSVLRYDDSPASDDGFDAALRTLEFAGNAWVDPKAWAYFVGAVEDEALNVEEAAVHFTGLGGNNVIRAGRFFVDFGKQMQTHVHELRTLERPLVLREYLGDEVKGEGLEWDSWTGVGEGTAVRWSIAALANTLPEEEEDFDPATEAAAEIDSSKELEDFNFTARVTAFTDLSDASVLQLGTSLRSIPRYSVVYDDGAGNTAQADSLSSNVLGLDLTYGWTGETGERKFTLGGEYLLSMGDNGFEVDPDPDNNPGTADAALSILDEQVGGFFVWADYAWDRFNSAGAQYSLVERADAIQSEAYEVELYFTRMFSEFHRLRLVLAHSDGEGDDPLATLALQYTAIVGAHGHGVNW
ncbi:MAG: hypothetical protein IT454_19040 [Planctomycetes bacterium]|nr:hypothetical protein [Planctomycetota bacterium]